MKPRLRADSARKTQARLLSQARGQLRRPNDAKAERGAGTVFVLAGAALAIVLALVITTLAQATIARHRAESLADLAALSGASSLPASCAVAGNVVRDGGGTVLACTITPEGGVRVEVQVTFQTEQRGAISSLITTLPPARARARAGPAP